MHKDIMIHTCYRKARSLYRRIFALTIQCSLSDAGPEVRAEVLSLHRQVRSLLSGKRLETDSVAEFLVQAEADIHQIRQRLGWSATLNDGTLNQLRSYANEMQSKSNRSRKSSIQRSDTIDVSHNQSVVALKLQHLVNQEEQALAQQTPGIVHHLSSKLCDEASLFCEVTLSYPHDARKLKKPH